MRAAAATTVTFTLCFSSALGQIGEDRALPNHLADGQEYTLPLKKLLGHGEKVFAARWTVQEGFGRPLSKGTGAALSDLSDPLVWCSRAT